MFAMTGRKQWLEETLEKLSRKSDTALAVRYALGGWKAPMRYWEDGASSRSTTTRENEPCGWWLQADRTSSS